MKEWMEGCVSDHNSENLDAAWPAAVPSTLIRKT
jgi:hypothetical protein